jgi:hypothetical protein
VPQRKTGISSSHLTVVITPEISRRNLILPSGHSHLLLSRHYGLGFFKSRAWVFVNEIPESLISDFPKQVISRHITSLNQTVHNCSGISTQQSPDTLSPGLPISRFPISQNGRSRNTWPPSIGRLKSILGFPHWKIPNSCQQESRFRDSRFPEMGDLATRGLHQSDDSNLSQGFHIGKS